MDYYDKQHALANLARSPQSAGLDALPLQPGPL